MGPIEREQRRLEALRFIGEQMNIATRMMSPEGPIRLSAQEAIEFIARHVPEPGQDDKLSGDMGNCPHGDTRNCPLC